MKLMRKMKQLLSAVNNNTDKYGDNIQTKIHVFTNAAENIYYLKSTFKNSQDIVYRHFYIGNTDRHVSLVYIDGMVEKNLVEDQIIKPVMKGLRSIRDFDGINIDIIKNKMISASKITEIKFIEDLILSLLSGNTLLFIDGLNYGISVGSKGASKRDVGVTTTEQTIRGPQEGFVEDLGINITQIRRRIKDPNLSVEILEVGERTHTDIGIVYLNGVVSQEIVKEIRNRISNISIDGIIGSAQIEQLIQENKWTLLPQMMATERPDRAASYILEGRVVIIVDGSPFVLTAPTTFAMLLNSPDDHYERAVVSIVIRLLRYMSFFLATTLPGAYVALTAFHPGMIPTKLALSITGTRVGLPFPVYFEVLLMEIAMDLLQEAAVRLPKPIGPTISIIGGIILGQAVVQAGIVSPIIVIIVSTTAVASFIVPVYSFTQTTRVLRFLLIFAASVLGLYGVIIVWINFIIHLASLESFGVRYLGDFSPINPGIIRDTIIKMPQSLQKKRPEALPNIDDTRQNSKKNRSKR